MSEIIAWIVAHWAELSGILFLLLSLASAITALTDTPEDDKWVRRILDFLSFLRPRDAAGTLKPPGTRTPAPDLVIEKLDGEKEADSEESPRFRPLR